jgi:tripartite-type tricarboxylate transporter receptor subunit TctC
MHRRTFNHCTIAAGVAAFTRPAAAQAAFPARNISLVVPFAAGGGGDVVARLLAKGFTERTGATVVVENRVGAGGNIGSSYVLKSAADGYTLLNMSSSYAIQAAVSKLPYDPIGDMQPILMVSRDPAVVVVNIDSPIRTAKDLVDAARAAPGRLTYGSAGVGSIAHLGMEELAYSMGIKLAHVPYKGSSQAFNDVLAKNVDMMLTSTTYAGTFIKAARVRAIGISNPQRLSFLPDLPTFAEQGWPQYQVVDWKAIAGPRGMPPEVVAYLNREMNEAMKRESISEKFRAEGTTMVGGTPEQMMQVVRSDIERWRNLVKVANIKVE